MSGGRTKFGLDGSARRMRIHAAALISYLALTVVMTWPLAQEFFEAIPGDSFDGWQNYWNLWWVKLALVDRVQNPFVTDILFYPTGVGLYFHTLNPFNGLATLPVQLAAGLIPAYNAVVYLSWTLGGYGVFLLTLYVLRGVNVQGRYVAALVAGAIFTFSPFHMAHLLGHMQVMSLQWIPFYILYLLRSMDRGMGTGMSMGIGAFGGSRLKIGMRDALSAGLFLILTGLCDWYFVLYLMLFTGMLVLWRSVAAAARQVLNQRGVPFAEGVRAFAVSLLAILGPPVVAGLLFLVVLSPILVPMLQEVRAHSFMVRPATDLYILSAALTDFLAPNRLHTLFRPESFEWMGNRIAPVSERTIGIGYLPLLLLVAAAGLDRKRTALWGIVGLFFLFMALGPRIHLAEITWDDIPVENSEAILRGERSPFGVVNQLVPMVRMSRSVSRYALMVQLAVAVAAGVGLAALSARLAGRRLSALWMGALVIVLAEFWVAPYPMSPPDTPEYYARLDSELPPGAMLNLPMNWDRPGYLLYQTVHKRPLTVAYISRDDPRTASERYPLLQHLRHLGPDILADDPAAVGQTVLADLGVGVVTLDRYKMPGGAEREVTEALAAQVFGGETPRYEDHRITVYAVEPPESPAPYLALGPLNWGALEQLDTNSEAYDKQGLQFQRRRALSAEPATVLVHHLTGVARLTIHFRGEAGATLFIREPDGHERQFVAGLEGDFDADQDRGNNSAEENPPEMVTLDPVPGETGEPIEIELWATGGAIDVYSLMLEW